MQYLLFALVLLAGTVSAFKTVSIKSRAPRVKPVHENFFLDIAEDPAVNTPSEIFGEVAYKNFADKTVPNNLLTGSYDAVTRIRELKLLSLTVDSGLLEALEEKGLTLSQVEKLLPVADDLGLLPLLVQNKDLALSLAPLLIEPAPLLLPLLVNVIKTPSTTFSAAGAALVGLGGYETLNDAGLLGVPLALLGAPLLVLGSVLSGSVSIPTPAPGAAPKTVAVTSSKPAATAAPKVSVPVPTVRKGVSEAPKPSAGRVSVSAAKSSGGTRRRKVVKVN